MIAPATALDITGLGLSYGNHIALSDINLTIKSGALTALIGPNGAGKSSLVKAICGRTPITNGSVFIHGVNANSRAARAALGVAPQSTALYDHLTALENLICFGRQAGLKKAKATKRAGEILSLIGMESAAHVKAMQMSGGMRQRINIGAAIVHRPALVILDEPAASLDPKGVEQVNALIATLKKENYAILLITHDMAQAEQLAGTVIILCNGKIYASGKPQTIVKKLCGDALKISLNVTNTAAIEKCGFSADAAKPALWSKSLLQEEDIADELAALATEGVSLNSLSVTAANLNDALDVVVRMNKRPETPA